MKNFYIYLLSSLPMLQFGMKPPFNFTRWFQMCADFLSPAELRVLEELPEEEKKIEESSAIPLIREKRDFEVTLRNELVKLRAARRHVDAHKYLRTDKRIEEEMLHLANSAVRNPSALAAELELDQARWKVLDNLSLGHYFDFETLVAYGYKLLILERWERIHSCDKKKIFQEVLEVAK